MTYKTFSIRGGTSAWGNSTGKEIALYGGFFNRDTAKTFRAVKTVVLCEQVPTKESQQRYGSDWWFVQADADTIDRAQKLLDQPRDYHSRPELIIKSRGTKVESITPYMGVCPE